MKYLKHTLLLLSIALVGSLTLASCHIDDDFPEEEPGQYQYSLIVPNANDEVLVVLDSLSSPIKSIGDCPDWVVVTADGETEEGYPIIRLKLKNSGPGVMNQCAIMILTERGDQVTLSLTQSVYIVDDSNTMEEFLTNWEKQKTVTIFSNRGYQSIPTPWATETITTLPESIRYDVKKKDGWEMAFSFLNRESFDDCNYFALYNRYLGILRVFYYVTNSATTGSEHSFEVDLGSTSKDNKFPFYHSLAYSIPLNHTSLSNTVNMLGKGINSKFTFKSFFSPYIAMTSTALSKGWTAFDINASAYSPADKNWLTSGEQIHIACRTISEKSITLNGTLSANISGKYSSAEHSASASSGVSSMLSTLGGILGDVRNSSLAAINKQVTGSPVDVYFYYAGVACNVASFAYDFLTQNKYAENATDSMPGKIEMSMTGDIDLSGYITSFSSNLLTPITLTGSTILNTNKSSNFGKGVWNLASDPVVYVVDDCILGDVRRFSMTVNGDGTYGCTDADDYHLRMVSFLDPTSIKLNINTEIFPDVSDVTVTCNYGVYPDVKKGHTSKYVSLLSLDRPTVKISDGQANSVYKSGDADNKLKYIQASHTDFMSKVFEETKDNCKLIKQKDANYSYYGKLVNCEGKNFIMSPQLYFPIKKTETSILLCDGEMPDFVVLVNVSFKSDGRTYIFSQRFLPQIKLIKGNEVKTKYQDLVAYKTASESKSAINSLQNKSSVGVKHPHGAACIQKTLDILKKITE